MKLNKETDSLVVVNINESDVNEIKKYNFEGEYLIKKNKFSKEGELLEEQEYLIEGLKTDKKENE